MSDPVFRCPGCGAAASIDSVRCEYCRIPLSTTNCAACFEPMFVGSRYCPHCGVEVAREVAADVPALNCPHCHALMSALRLGSIRVQECGGCGGLWLDPDTLQHLVESKEDSMALVNAITTHVPTATIPPGVVRYLPCPVCAKLMNRVNFSKMSGVIVDVCKSHGVWLDRGELQGVLTFVQGGGLQAARERERTQLHDEQLKLAAMQKWSVPLGGAGAFTPQPAPPTELDLGHIIDRSIADTQRSFVVEGLAFVAASLLTGLVKNRL